VTVQRVGGHEASLERDEPPDGAALEGNEEESCVDLAAVGFCGFAVGVASSEDPLSAIALGVREPDVRVGRDQWFAVGSRGLQLDGVILALAAERGASELVAANRSLLVFEGRSVPTGLGSE
jgi:hypothetical protein